MQEQEFLTHITPLRTVARRIGQQFFGNAEDADDVAQDTMLRLWAAREQIDASRPVEPLVWRVARNVCVSMWRKRPNIEALEDEVWTATPQTLLEERENEEWLRRRFRALPEYLQRVLRMKQEEALGTSQIAEILGTDVRSVQTLLSKARHQLFNDLKRRNRNDNK